jgi:hypothetical protein
MLILQAKEIIGSMARLKDCAPVPAIVVTSVAGYLDVAIR